MTPIDRLSARSKALSVLGLSGRPTKSELRQVFRKLAFEKHPDQGDGSAEEFAQISDAYRLLSEIVEDDARACIHVSRPTVPVTETEFSEEIIELCESVFEGDADLHATRHLATRLYRKGRVLTYFVPTRPANGLNRVALPTGDLVDHRSTQPKCLDIWPGDISAGIYDVPAQTADRIFPGARAVQIRFGDATQH